MIRKIKDSADKIRFAKGMWTFSDVNRYAFEKGIDGKICQSKNHFYINKPKKDK